VNTLTAICSRVDNNDETGSAVTHQSDKLKSALHKSAHAAKIVEVGELICFDDKQAWDEQKYLPDSHNSTSACEPITKSCAKLIRYS